MSMCSGSYHLCSWTRTPFQFFCYLPEFVPSFKHWLMLVLCLVFATVHICRNVNQLGLFTVRTADLTVSPTIRLSTCLTHRCLWPVPKSEITLCLIAKSNWTRRTDPGNRPTWCSVSKCDPYFFLSTGGI